MPSSLDWRGEEVKTEVRKRLVLIMGEYGLTVEGESKEELQKGHGVKSGTLRRSIHSAEPGYDWGGDDVEPAAGTPDRGGNLVEAAQEGGLVSIQVGSGLNYAMPVHQGHHSFEGYHFLTNGEEKARTRLPAIIAKYRIER